MIIMHDMDEEDEICREEGSEAGGCVIEQKKRREDER